MHLRFSRLSNVVLDCSLGGGGGGAGAGAGAHAGAGGGSRSRRTSRRRRRRRRAGVTRLSMALFVIDDGNRDVGCLRLRGYWS